MWTRCLHVAKILEWVAISFFRGTSGPKVWICGSCVGRQILHHLRHLGSPMNVNSHARNSLGPKWLRLFRSCVHSCRFWGLCFIWDVKNFLIFKVASQDHCHGEFCMSTWLDPGMPRLFLGASVRAFPNEISSWKVGWPSPVWVGAIQLIRAWIKKNVEEGGIYSFNPASLLSQNIAHLLLPLDCNLCHRLNWFTSFWTQTVLHHCLSWLPSLWMVHHVTETKQDPSGSWAWKPLCPQFLLCRKQASASKTFPEFQSAGSNSCYWEKEGNLETSEEQPINSSVALGQGPDSPQGIDTRISLSTSVGNETPNKWKMPTTWWDIINSREKVPVW